VAEIIKKESRNKGKICISFNIRHYTWVLFE